MSATHKPRFLITGHGRSGTNYMAALFRHLGYDVGTQTVKANGMAHNFPGGHEVVPVEQYFDKARKVYGYLIQVVRDPEQVVESTYLAKYSLPKQNSGMVPEIMQGNDLDKAIRSVVLWNRAIASCSPDLVVQLEQAKQMCVEWLESMDLPVEISGDEPPEDINARTPEGWHMDREVPWEDASEESTDMLRAHCAEYGYPEIP